MASAKSTFKAVDDWWAKLNTSVDKDAVKRVSHKAGAAGKRATLIEARRALGADRRFSGWPRKKARLGAGYELGARSGTVEINLRPVGLWVLADSGRKRSGKIYPRTPGGRKARRRQPGRALQVAPGVYRVSSSYGPSRGTGARQKAQRGMEIQVPSAAASQFRRELRRALKGGGS